ncbi:hypothetical protein LDENG_00025170 [Lucifuga dentata]|nr:hypothetical protein LDENG_00025170 [Lucifuga dentata]
MPTEESYWPPQPRSPNSCSVFSHTAIGPGALSIKFTLTCGSASTASSRNFIGYCTLSCSLRTTDHSALFYPADSTKNHSGLISLLCISGISLASAEVVQRRRESMRERGPSRGGK